MSKPSSSNCDALAIAYVLAATAWAFNASI